MTAIVTRTYAQIIEDIARRLGDIEATGTNTGTGAATYLNDTINLIHDTDDVLNGYEVYITGGTNAGKARTITDFDATTNDRITFPTMTSICDTTTTYIILRIYRVPDIQAAINRVIRIGMRKFLTHKEDQSIILGSPLLNGHFETFTVTTTDAAVATNWTPDSNSTRNRESSIIRTGKYAYKLTTDGTNVGTLSQSVADFPLYAGQSVSLRAHLFTATASRTKIRLTDGITTWNSDAHDLTGWGGDGGNYMALDNKSIGDNATELTASIQISAGAAVTAYASKMWIEGGRTANVADRISEYPIPSGFTYIKSLQADYVADDKFEEIPQRKYRIDKENSKIVFTDRSAVESGRVLRIIGQGSPSALSAVTDTCDFSDYVIARACQELLLSKPWGQADREAKQNMYVAFRDEADKLERYYMVRPPIGSIPVKEI